MPHFVDYIITGGSFFQKIAELVFYPTLPHKIKVFSNEGHTGI